MSFLLSFSFVWVPCTEAEAQPQYSHSNPAALRTFSQYHAELSVSLHISSTGIPDVYNSMIFAASFSISL